MSGPLVFTLGDKDYIQKLNQMSANTGDTLAAKAAAETARTQALQAVTDARNAGAAEVSKAAQEVAKAATHAANVQAISQSGLPNQTGMARAALVSNGTTATWEQIEVVTGPLTANTTINRTAQKTTILVDTRAADLTVTLAGFFNGDQVEIVKLYAPRVLTVVSLVSMQAPEGVAETSHTLSNVAATLSLFRGASVFTMTIR